MSALRHIQHDGGRAAAGFTGTADDCVTRAIAIATGRPYDSVYSELFARAKADPQALRQLRATPDGVRAARRISPRNGLPRPVYEAYLFDLGWLWTPTMRLGQGCSVHLRAGELPDGWLICRLSKHLTAVCDGRVYDTHDPTRAGTRCVYGYYSPGPNAITATAAAAG